MESVLERPAVGTLRAAIYTRVSSTGQEQDGTSLETQETACRAYIADHGYNLDSSHVYREVYSGASLWDRPQLTRARTAIRDGEVDVLVAYALDRLSRSQAHVYILDDEFTRHGCRWEFVTERFEDSATGRFLQGAKAFAAELEREKIIERTVRGRRASARNGKLLPRRIALYGYQRNEDHSAYVVDPLAAPIVVRIFQRSLQGVSIRSIGRELDRDGVPVPDPKRAGPWNHSSIRNVLTNPTYMGQAAQWRTAAEKPPGAAHRVQRSRPVEEHIPLPPGTIPALVDADTFAAVQARLSLNKRFAARNARDPELGLLRNGFARCGYCGRALSLITYRRGEEVSYHYACTKHTPRCGTRIAQRILDAAIWGKVERVLTNPTVIQEELRRMQDEDTSAADLAANDHALSQAEGRRRQFVRSWMDMEATAPLDDETRADARASLAEIERRIQDLNAERKLVQARHQTWQRSRDQLLELETWCGSVAAKLAGFSYEQRRTALLALRIEVRVWRQGHEPRYEVIAQPDPNTPILTTSSGACSSSSARPGSS
jgi:site-specific DNA recombinase